MPTKQLWVDLNGALVCDEHAGAMLRAAIERKPLARSHSTTITVWRRVTGKEILDWKSTPGLEEMGCESCRVVEWRSDPAHDPNPRVDREALRKYLEICLEVKGHVDELTAWRAFGDLVQQFLEGR